jgi:hypothetical protein
MPSPIVYTSEDIHACCILILIPIVIIFGVSLEEAFRELNKSFTDIQDVCTFLVVILIITGSIAMSFCCWCINYARPRAWFLFRETCYTAERGDYKDSVIDAEFAKFTTYHYRRFNFHKLPTDSIMEIGKFLKVKDYLGFLATTKKMRDQHYCRNTRQCFVSDLRLKDFPMYLSKDEDASQRIYEIQECVSSLVIKTIPPQFRSLTNSGVWKFWFGNFKNLRILKFYLPKCVLRGIELLEHLEELYIQADDDYGDYDDDEEVAFTRLDFNKSIKSKSRLKILHINLGFICNLKEICMNFPNLETLNLNTSTVKRGELGISTLKKLKFLTMDDGPWFRLDCLSECKNLVKVKLMHWDGDLKK